VLVALMRKSAASVTVMLRVRLLLLALGSVVAEVRSTLFGYTPAPGILIFRVMVRRPPGYGTLPQVQA